MLKTFENMLQYLEGILKKGDPNDEKLRQVEAWCFAARQQVRDLYEGEENEQEKRTKKEEEKEVLDKNQSSESLNSHEASNNSPQAVNTSLAKTKYLTPEEMRRKVRQEFLDEIESKWLMIKYPSLMTQMTTPLSGAQYMSWLTRYPQSFIEQKLLSLEVAPSHYNRTNVPATINDWIKKDYEKLTLVQRQRWDNEVAAQRPQILQMINNNLKPKRNGKQTTINF